jgi:hypothetical protein
MSLVRLLETRTTIVTLGNIGNPCRFCRFFGPLNVKLSRLGVLCVKFGEIRFR